MRRARCWRTSDRSRKKWIAQDGKHYILRVLPYRSEGHIVQGVVLTLSDVTTLKKAQAGARGGQGTSVRRFAPHVTAA